MREGKTMEWGWGGVIADWFFSSPLVFVLATDIEMYDFFVWKTDDYGGYRVGFFAFSFVLKHNFGISGCREHSVRPPRPAHVGSKVPSYFFLRDIENNFDFQKCSRIQKTFTEFRQSYRIQQTFAISKEWTFLIFDELFIWAFLIMMNYFSIWWKNG